MSVENENALKHMFGKQALKEIAEAIKSVYPAFQEKQFYRINKKLSELEMKPRVQLIRDELKNLLPDNYKETLKILLNSRKSGDLQGFMLWPYTEFIQTFGLEHPQESLKALKEITPFFTSEWGVRPFLRLYPIESLNFLLKCSLDKNVHVRRWASEGSRSRLPWGERLHQFIKSPKETLPIISNLKFDDEMYVRKSVANHLNDIAKDNPDIVIKTLKKWSKEAKISDDKIKIDWIIRHALRTLIKNGHEEALALIGVSTNVDVKLNNFKLETDKLKMGDKLQFSFELESKSKSPEKLVIDYIIHFVKANKSKSAKVFKLKTFVTEPKSKIAIKKSHHIKPITTRVYHSGTHLIEIQVNGKKLATKEWELSL